MEYETLHVQMFGKFVMHYGNTPVALKKQGSAKTVRMLQMVLLAGDEGIPKQELIDTLYEWTDPGETISRNRNMNNLIYRLRKQMTAAGLPDESLIVIRDATCYWNDQIPLEVDTRDFVKLYEKAQHAIGYEQTTLYQRANELYLGELLPANLADMWFYEKSIYYKELYVKTIRILERTYRRYGSYKELVDLYGRAATIYPFDNWQPELIRTYVDGSRFEEARQCYNETRNLYENELGMPPTPEMRQCFEYLKRREHSYIQKLQINERLEDQGGPAPSDLGPEGTIAREIFGGRFRGAYYCSYSSFVDYCRVLMRSMERRNRDMVLVFVALESSSRRERGKGKADMEELDTQMVILKEVITSCVRCGDAFTRYGSRHYILMLVDTNKRSCRRICKRITDTYKQQPDSTGEIRCESLRPQDVGIQTGIWEGQRQG